ncbi:hypothetical protein J2I47_05905 [Fibrella sp. HMF5335]|uniref:Uncharacterized protein n=1 Tax=Fibrella rubiginis TaxID=2817060 RepID=A0A939GFY6_9BACT|nr:hypothetical protein [Fibrella rubiginis]MBO0936075.1 hypothetical protein [Fibrella rubiginis]
MMATDTPLLNWALPSATNPPAHSWFRTITGPTGMNRGIYVFLPITITQNGKMELHWYSEWNLKLFTDPS